MEPSMLAAIIIAVIAIFFTAAMSVLANIKESNLRFKLFIVSGVGLTISMFALITFPALL
jgi:hypothetical protein